MRGAERAHGPCGGAGARGRDGWAAWRGRGKYNAATALLPAGINQRTAMPKCHQLALAAALLLSCAPVTVVARSAAPDLHRVGNRLMDKTTGEVVHLKGMAMMGGEYSCVHGQSVFAGPADISVVEGMAKWGINAIRLPMNEDCWLGLHGVDAKYSGKAYQDRFVEFTELLLSHGFVVVLDLHWTNSTGGLALGQDFLMSRDSPRFWASVAAHPALKSRPGVVFELFNEPHQGEVRETLFGVTFICFWKNPIILPRQARDNHRKTS